MNNPLLLTRLARAGGMTITVFLFLFLLLDVWQSIRPDDGFTQLVTLVVSHLLWPGIALGMTLMSWKNQRLGVWLFAGAGIGYVAMAWGRFPLSVYLLIAGPFFLTSILHGVAWRFSAERQA